MCKFNENEEPEILSFKSLGKRNIKQEKNELKNEFQKIKKFRNVVSKMNIFKRKIKAKNRYKKFLENNKDKILKIKDEKEDIKEQYIKIVRLLLIDNTNKDIVKLYLDFIKKNEIFIKENDLLPFEEEVKKYSIIFTVDEMNKIEKNIKIKSQKNIFLDFLDYIQKIDSDNESKVNEFYDYAEETFKSLFIFNTPIEFENKELYYYKCYYNLLKEITYYLKITEDKKKYIKNKQNVITYILNNNLYNNKQIISNEDKMNLLFLYLLKEEFPEYKDGSKLVNFNRLTQPMPVTINDFINLKNKNKNDELFKKENGKYYISHKLKDYWIVEEEEEEEDEDEEDKMDNEEKEEEEEEEDDDEEEEENKNNEKINVKEKEEENEEAEIIIPLTKICLNNLNNSYLNASNCTKYSYYNLDTLLVENEISPFIATIKKFLKEIINSKVYKQAIKELFPNSYKCLLYNENRDIKQFIKKRIKFYPFQDLFISGITDKLSCYSYIPTINFEIVENLREPKNKGIYKIGLTIINLLHEINHANQCIIYFKTGNKNLLYTTERKEKIYSEKKENKENLECLLFGKNIFKVNLFQCLYIMNENNYKQNLKKFRENFENIKHIVEETNGNTKFIKIKKGIFKKFYEGAKLDIKNLMGEIKKNVGFIPSMIIGNSKIFQENDIYIPEKKCGLIGGGNIFD